MTATVPISYATQLQGLFANLRDCVTLLSHYTYMVKPTPFSVVRDTKRRCHVASCNARGGLPPQPKTPKTYSAANNNMKHNSRSTCHPWSLTGITCNISATIPQSRTACTDKLQIKWKSQYEMARRKDYFFFLFLFRYDSFSVRAQTDFKYNIQSWVSLARCQ